MIQEATLAQEINGLDTSLRSALKDRQYGAAKYIAVVLADKVEAMDYSVSEFLYQQGVR